MKTDIINFVPKGWGYEKWIHNSDLYCGKILFFVKGKKCSWHYHEKKDEVFYVLSGKVVVLYSGENHGIDFINLANKIVLVKGEKWHVPTGMRHRIIALEDSEILEISTHHEDSDSFRIEVGD